MPGIGSKLSGNGQYIVYQNGQNGEAYVYDQLTGVSTIASVASDGSPSNCGGSNPVISDDGRYVAFVCAPINNLLPPNGSSSIIRHDMQTGQNQYADVLDSGLGLRAGGVLTSNFVISGDGSAVGFVGTPAVFTGDTIGQYDYDQWYVHSFRTNRTALIDADGSGNWIPYSSTGASLNYDGSLSTFLSDAYDDDANEITQAYVNETTGTGKEDVTAPVGQPFDIQPLQVDPSDTVDVQPAPFTVAFTDDRTGVFDGEYFIGADPGVGHGIHLDAEGNGVWGNVAQLSGSINGTGMAQGTYNVSVRARDASGNWSEAQTAQLQINYPDTTPPSVTNVAIGPNPKAYTQPATLTAQVTDNLSGVSYVEYYQGSDPGAGSGTPMTLNGTTASAQISAGSDFPAGSYVFYVRSYDGVGNWSSPVSVTMDVYNPSAGYSAGHGFITPSGPTSDVGDYLPAVSGNNVKGTFDFTAKYATSTSSAPTGSSTFTYGSNCNTPKGISQCFIVSFSSFDWLMVPGNGTATFQGLAALSLNGQSQGANYPASVTIFDGGVTGVPDHYKIQVYPVGSRPDLATPLYQASGDTTGGNIVLHQ